MNIVNILKKPVITEKTYKLMEMNKYVFVVHPQANKGEIKIAFEKIFGVKVQDVNLLKLKPKKKRVGRFLGKKPGVKKAIITLKPGQKLDAFKTDDEKVQSNKTLETKSIFERFKSTFSKSKPNKNIILPKNENDKIITKTVKEDPVKEK